ncbi:hypothetical protein ASL14_14400 [Paenibacillus sp. IHB B 3084]|nr:hypothetical protein ASL14_14400 [Paenibacillus sp. IHB B 3084]
MKLDKCQILNYSIVYYYTFNKHCQKRVGAVATTGYIAFLVGPPGLGFLGESFGLLHAMIAVLIGVILAGLLSDAAKPMDSGGTRQ